jgi:uncharacterized protein (TIRG00374 family)
MGGSLNKWIKTIIKIVISLTLLGLIFYFVGPKKIYNVLLAIDLIYFIIVIFIGMFCIAISALKWQLLLRAKGEKMNFLVVWGLYYIGMFFNMFFPTSVGGDLVKAHKMSKRSKKPVEAYSSVFMERLTGGIILVLLALVATTLYLSKLPLSVYVFVYFVFPPVLIIIILFLMKKALVVRFRPLYNPIFGMFKRFEMGPKVERLYDSINLYRKKKIVIGWALIISLIFQTLAIILYYLLSLSVGMDVPLHFFFIFIPISMLFSFLPISIRGLGIQEGVFMYLFTQVGATAAEAVSLGLLGQIYLLIPTIMGFLIYVLTDEKKKRTGSKDN